MVDGLIERLSLSFPIKIWFNLGIMALSFGLISCGQENGQNTKETSTTQEVLLETLPVQEGKIILFFGNSITAGYGIEPSEAFPALIQEIIDSEGLNYQVINAGLSGETTASGKNRVQWVLKQKVDVFVLELGGNDGLRGISPDETRRNIQEIIDIVRAENSETLVVLAGMQIPPNMGELYASEFRQVFPDIAKANNALLIPFLLEGVGGERDLNQPDGIHPTTEGHKIVAQNVWSVLGPNL